MDILTILAISSLTALLTLIGYGCMFILYRVYVTHRMHSIAKELSDSLNEMTKNGGLEFYLEPEETEPFLEMVVNNDKDDDDKVH